jgi:hypothetical protein
MFAKAYREVLHDLSPVLLSSSFHFYRDLTTTIQWNQFQDQQLFTTLQGHWSLNELYDQNPGLEYHKAYVPFS